MEVQHRNCMFVLRTRLVTLYPTLQVCDLVVTGKVSKTIASCSPPQNRFIRDNRLKIRVTAEFTFPRISHVFAKCLDFPPRSEVPRHRLLHCGTWTAISEWVEPKLARACAWVLVVSAIAGERCSHCSLPSLHLRPVGNRRHRPFQQ